MIFNFFVIFKICGQIDQRFCRLLEFPVLRPLWFVCQIANLD